MKKFSIVLSVLAAIAAIAGIYFAAVEFLKRKGGLSEEEEFDEEGLSLDEDIPEEVVNEDESISFSEDDEELSFMEEEAFADEAPSEDAKEEPKEE